VGGVIVLTNARTIMKAADVASGIRPIVYAFVVAAWALAITLSVRALRRTRRAAAATPAAPHPTPTPALDAA
jgi:hypothetical protein